jgi:hypothetical protein
MARAMWGVSRVRILGLGAAAATAAFSLASSAMASTVLISADHLASTAYTTVLGGTVDGTAFDLNVYESPDILTASLDGGPSEQLLVFCVDIFHGFDPDNTPPITYQTGLLTTDSSGSNSGTGVALSPLISGQIGYLASLYSSNMGAEALAGIQGAIWLTEYSGLTLTGGSSQVAQFQVLGSDWAATHASNTAYADAIYSVGGNTQGFVIGGGVPEPASWAMMIAGFGLAGAMLRRRRPVAATA